MNNAYTGALGEVYASRYLRQNGFEILSSNYRGRYGEIDIIAFRDGIICFVEVKTRNLNSIASPAEFVDERKQKRISSVAAKYMQQEKEYAARFDVIEILLDDKMQVEDINHIINAFTLS